MIINYFHQLAKMKNTFLLNFRYLYELRDTQKKGNNLPTSTFNIKPGPSNFNLKYHDGSENGYVP